MPNMYDDNCQPEDTGRTKWDSSGTNLPTGVLPLSEQDEANIIYTLIGELNKNLAMDFDPRLSITPGSVRKKSKIQLLIVGASHAD